MRLTAAEADAYAKVLLGPDGYCDEMGGRWHVGQVVERKGLWKFLGPWRTVLVDRPTAEEALAEVAEGIANVQKRDGYLDSLARSARAGIARGKP